MNELCTRDAKVCWHPYTQHGMGVAPLAVVGADGAWLELADGRRVLDGIASWWTIIHGHGHPAIVEAIAHQARRLDHVQFAGATHEPAVALAERLVSLTPEGLSRVFFSDDGSTAVEIALKMSLAYQARRGQKERTRFLALEHAYHGDTAGAMSVSARSPFTADFQPMTFDVARVPIPGPDKSLADCRLHLETLLEREGRSYAALIVEPLLMGAAGMRVTSEAFLGDLRNLTAAHGVLLIADEVLTGFGRTGPLFASSSAGPGPDLLCLSKALTGGALPLAATLAREEVFAAFVSAKTDDAFLHGHTFTANPIGCAAALASLDLLDGEALARGVAIGERLEARLTPLSKLPNVREIRGRGIVRAVQLADPEERGYLAGIGPSLAATALEHGVFLRPLGNVLYALPPLCITDAELDQIANAISEAVRANLETPTPGE